MNERRSSRPSTSARRAAGSSSAASGPTAWRWTRCTASRTSRSSWRTGCTGTHSGCTTRSSPGCARRGGRHPACAASASTRGALTSAGSTRRGRSSATRSTTATRARSPPSSASMRGSRASELYRAERPPGPAVQHALPARGRARDAIVRDRANGAADARPARLLAYRGAAGRAHDRLNHRFGRPPDRGRGTSGSSRRSSLDPSLLPRLAEPGEVRGRLLPGVREATGLGRVRGGHRSSGRTTQRPRSPPSLPRPTRSRTSRAAPGRWSGVEIDGADPDRGQPGRRLHERGRRRRHDAVPAQRHRDCGCSRSRCGRGSGRGRRSRSSRCSRPPRRCRPGGRSSTRTIPRSWRPGDMPRPDRRGARRRRPCGSRSATRDGSLHPGQPRRRPTPGPSTMRPG